MKKVVSVILVGLMAICVMGFKLVAKAGKNVALPGAMHAGRLLRQDQKPQPKFGLPQPPLQRYMRMSQDDVAKTPDAEVIYGWQQFSTSIQEAINSGRDQTEVTNTAWGSVVDSNCIRFNIKLSDQDRFRAMEHDYKISLERYNEAISKIESKWQRK